MQAKVNDLHGILRYSHLTYSKVRIFRISEFTLDLCCSIEVGVVEKLQYRFDPGLDTLKAMGIP